METGNNQEQVERPSGTPTLAERGESAADSIFAAANKAAFAIAADDDARLENKAEAIRQLYAEAVQLSVVAHQSIQLTYSQLQQAARAADQPAAKAGKTMPKRRKK